jgi:hypothetical protein
MHTYVKLKDGRLMILWSDNTDEETMHGYSADEENYWDCEWDVLEKWNYSDVVRTDTNKFIANM